MRESCGLPEGCGVGPVRPARGCRCGCAEASHGRGNACRSPRPKRQGANVRPFGAAGGSVLGGRRQLCSELCHRGHERHPAEAAVTWSNQVSVVRSSCRASRSSRVRGTPASGARGAAAGLRGWRRRGGWRRRSPGSAGPASRGVRCSGRRRCRRSRRRCRPCRRCRPRSRRPRRYRGPGGAAAVVDDDGDEQCVDGDGAGEAARLAGDGDERCGGHGGLLSAGLTVGPAACPGPVAASSAMRRASDSVRTAPELPDCQPDASCRADLVRTRRQAHGGRGRQTWPLCRRDAPPPAAQSRAVPLHQPQP